MKCIHCGWKNPATVTFCRKCGVLVTTAPSGHSPTSFPPPSGVLDSRDTSSGYLTALPPSPTTGGLDSKRASSGYLPTYPTSGSLATSGKLVPPRESTSSGTLNSSGKLPTFDVPDGRSAQIIPPAKRKGRLRLVLVLLAFLVIGGGGILWWIVSSSQPVKAISQTLQTYCTALQQENYQQAYDQWVAGTQISEADFTYTQKNKARTTSCEINGISVSDSTAQATLIFFYADGSSMVDQINLVLINGTWKIKGQSLS